MLSQMREGKFVKNVFWVVVVTFIISMVFVWGADYQGIGCGDNSPQGERWVGMVGDEGLSLRDYDQNLRNSISQLSRGRQSGQVIFDDEYLRTQDQVFDAMVNESLVKQEVARLGLTANDSEVLDILQHDPPDIIRNQFSDESGNFDWNSYGIALNNPNMNWKPFEDYVRASLPGERLQQIITACVHVGEGDVRREFERRFVKAKVLYVGRNWREVELENDDPGDDALRAHYQAHLDDYEEGERWTIRAVQFSRDPSEGDEAYIRGRLEFIKGEIEKGKSFEDMARDYSQDMSNAELGGDLGWFDRGRMDPAFTEAAFALGDGEVSDPLRSAQGYHLIKTEEHRTDGPSEEVRARHILLRVEPSYATQDSITVLSDSLRTLAKERESLATAAEALGLELISPPAFSLRESIEGMGYNSAAKARIASMETGDVSYRIAARDANYIIELLDVREPGPAAFAAVRDRVLSAWKRDEQKRIAREELEAVQETFRAGRLTLSEAAEQHGLEAKETEQFARQDYLPGIGSESSFHITALMLNQDAFSGIVETGQGSYIMEILEKIPSDKTVYPAEHDKILEELKNNAQQIFLQDWLENLKNRYEVKDWRKRFYNNYED